MRLEQSNSRRRDFGIVCGSQYDVKDLLFINNNLLDIIDFKNDFNEFGFTSHDIISTGSPGRRYIIFLTSIIKSLEKGYVISSNLKTRKFISKHFDLLKKMKDLTGHSKIGRIFEEITSSGRMDGYIEYVSYRVDIEKANALLNRLQSLGIKCVDFYIYDCDYELKNKHDSTTVYYLDNLKVLPSNKILFEKTDDTNFALFGSINKTEDGESLELSDVIHLKGLSIDPESIPSNVGDFKSYIDLLKFKHNIMSEYKKVDNIENTLKGFSENYNELHKIEDSRNVYNKLCCITDGVNEVLDAVNEYKDERYKEITERDEDYLTDCPVTVKL